jgi:uncharacterized membrane protein
MPFRHEIAALAMAGFALSGCAAKKAGSSDGAVTGKVIRLIDPTPSIAAKMGQASFGFFANAGVSAVNRDGSVVVGFSSVQANEADGGIGVPVREAFRWSERGGVEGLGVLPGDAISDAELVSADGLVVAGQSGAPATSPDSQRAFVWTKDSGLTELSSGPAIPEDVSDDGLVVVGSLGHTTLDARAFRWSRAGGLVDLAVVAPSFASFVRAGGSVVIGVSGARDGVVFRYTEAGGMVNIGGDTTWSVAGAASTDGNVIAGNSSAGAFRWTASSGLLPLGMLGDAGCWVVGASADGGVIIGRCGHSDENGEGPQKPFRWTESSGIVGLDLLAGDRSSQAECVSADGSVVVGTSEGLRQNHPFIWDRENGVRSLTSVFDGDPVLLAGWTLDTDAHFGVCISADGRVVIGVAEHPVHGARAFAATLR